MTVPRPAVSPTVHLWRYRENRRNYPGYHITADGAGCEVLLRVLSAHEHATAPIRTQLALAPVTTEILAVPANARGDASVVSLASLEFVTDPTWPRELFTFRESHPYCTLDLSAAQAGCLIEGVNDIKRGKGDYCVGGHGDHVIWFWWYPGPS